MMIVLISISEQIACIKREIAMRERNYPKWVAAGRMKETDSARELERIRAVLDTLEQYATFGLP